MKKVCVCERERVKKRKIVKERKKQKKNVGSRFMARFFTSA